MALTELERGVEALLADDALQATRTQLQQELHQATGAAGEGEGEGEGEGDLDASFAQADENDEDAMRGRLQLQGRERDEEPPEDEDEEIILQPLQQQVVSSQQSRTPRHAPNSPHRHAAAQRPHTPTPQHPQLEAL